jgi:hypothetical protein
VPAALIGGRERRFVCLAGVTRPSSTN